MRARAAFPAGVLAVLAGARLSAAEGPARGGEQRLEALRFVSGFFGFDGAGVSEDRARLTVIGAGFSRTGTKSLEAALVRLGHKIYDIRSMLALGHVPMWEEAAKELMASGNTTLIDRLLDDMEGRGFTATLDLPMNLFAGVFAKRRPAAKVIMSIRPSVDSWFEAWATVNRILCIFIARPWRWLIPVDMNFNTRLLKTLRDFDWEFPTYPAHIRRPLPWFEIIERFPAFETEAKRQDWKDLHNSLERELRAELPEERFTTYDVRSGWVPLLRFLGIDDPALAAEPFPRVNDRKSLETVRLVMDVLAVGLPVLILLAVRLLYACARCACQACRAKKKSE